MNNEMRSEIFLTKDIDELRDCYYKYYSYFNLLNYDKDIYLDEKKRIFNNIKNYFQVLKIANMIHIQNQSNLKNLINLEIGINKLIEYYSKFKVTHEQILYLLNIRDYYLLQKKNKKY